jgi:hypothetical protein
LRPVVRAQTLGSMSVLKTLRERIAPELNYLYTTPPFTTPTGIECGWHAREHALHTFFVARLLGVAADLRSGDFAVLSREMPPLTSMGTNSPHAWCSVNAVAPVDFSLTFHFFGRGPALRGPVCGDGANGDWQVRYAKDEALLDEKVQSGPEILFIERRVHDDAPEALLENPYLFLPPPQPGDHASAHAVFGPDIYAKVSLHCFRCATDEKQTVRDRFARPQAMAWIAENYPAPEAQIRNALKV